MTGVNKYKYKNKERMFIFILGLFAFCPNCVHYTKPDHCDLFKKHILFKDRPDIDFIGKEICGEKGKYFLSGRNSSIYEQDIFKGKFKKRN